MERASSYRFPIRNRLLDARSFSRVFDKAARCRDPLFTVLYRDNDSDVARLGLAISKKNCRKAVERNRIKRIIRESFRHHAHRLAGLDVVVLNQSAAAGASNPALFESLERHWRCCERGPQIVGGGKRGGRQGRQTTAAHGAGTNGPGKKAGNKISNKASKKG